MEKEKNKRLSEDEYFILDVMRYIGMEADDAVGTMFFLKENGEKKDENLKKLRKYIEFKGKYITKQDIMSKTLQIILPEQQYYPWEMYVKYISDTTEQLIKDKVYRVELVLGVDEYFFVKCENNCTCGFEAELFEVLDVTQILYKGYEEKDGTLSVSDGFTVGQRYKVRSLDAWRYICENGAVCESYEAEPVSFCKKVQKPPEPFGCIDDALKKVARAFEFGDVRGLSVRLHPFCEYVSQSGEKEFHTKKEIVEHLQKVSGIQLKEDIFLDCALATVTKSEAMNKFSENERCIAIFEKDGCQEAAFVTLDGEKRYITGIYILNEYYHLSVDEA